jgi:hypothetical protein
MTAPDQCCINVKKLLSIRRRRIEIPHRSGLLPDHRELCHQAAARRIAFSVPSLPGGYGEAVRTDEREGSALDQVKKRIKALSF